MYHCAKALQSGGPNVKVRKALQKYGKLISFEGQATLQGHINCLLKT